MSRTTARPPGDQPAKVLLVDDRNDNLIALQAILQGMPLVTVAVDSGEAALKQLLLDDFALILLDAHMPGMDGFETATHVKSRDRTRQIPIIFLTAADRDARLALRGYAAGAVDYLTKPFDPWILRAKVSVFVEMWAKNVQLQQQAERMDLLEASARKALSALRDGDADSAIEALEALDPLA
ncbi:MAG: response regulator [Hamadaea sp.]|uniref:response regulator n=1 Tax=Hamadaea sp. TaxID=2024425 RepID=UPI00182FE661|nr:response regulator [Hamadaea sp.]NUR69623.1 response regulator [Hamadaea sp.]NUT23329.1 response regulator [Hamadaea sp.]